MEVNKPSAQEFLGIISEDDILLMETAIKDGCGQIKPEDWVLPFSTK